MIAVVESGRARAGRRTWLAALVACLAGLLIAGGAALAAKDMLLPGRTTS
ncbi:MAG: hypothetical protein KC464_18485 [Myxococcales bacterium]|nr:hypothetical protein [Myxococcales bacterium]